MEFHWKKGCLPVKEWHMIAGAIVEIRKSVLIPNYAGFSENEEEYFAVDLLKTPEEIKFFAQIFKDFADSL